MNASPLEFSSVIASIPKRYPLSPFTRQRSTPDRYGFSFLISNQLKYTRIPRSFANWVHGWLWWSPQNLDEFGFQSDPPYYAKIVSNDSQLTFLRDLGVENVAAAGLPYAYQFISASTDDSGPARFGNTVVFVPDHTSESNKVNLNILKYLDFVDSVSHKFIHVSILLYSLDYAFLAPLVAQRGYTPLLGADPKCPNSFPRVKAIFDSHEYVSTNVIGSHVLYALASGCRVSICGPYQKRTLEPHLEDIRLGLYSRDYIDRIIHYMSLDYLRASWLSSFLVDDPAAAPLLSTELSARVDEELGISNLMSVSDIAELLGWSSDRQLLGYFNGAARRLKRFAGLHNRSHLLRKA
jgi:hypothetical protein